MYFNIWLCFVGEDSENFHSLEEGVGFVDSNSSEKMMKFRERSLKYSKTTVIHLNGGCLISVLGTSSSSCKISATFSPFFRPKVGSRKKRSNFFSSIISQIKPAAVLFHSLSRRSGGIKYRFFVRSLNSPNYLQKQLCEYSVIGASNDRSNHEYFQRWQEKLWKGR